MLLWPGKCGKFQSTPSAWRVTFRLFFRRRAAPISIHTLRVEGDAGKVKIPVRDTISIHTLRVEGDHGAAPQHLICVISIHTLRVEGDIKLNYYEE